MDKLTNTRGTFVTPLRDDIAWGLYCLGAGTQQIAPGPVDLIGNRGRILDCYSLVYITDGRGTFWSTAEHSLGVKQGDLILLFPGTWHRYKTDPKTGWQETWVMFDGVFAAHLQEQGILSPARAVAELGVDHQLSETLTAIVELLEAAASGFQQQAATRLMSAFARIHQLQANDLPTRQQRRNETIERAIIHLNKHAQGEVDLQALARSLSLSYSRFRQLFKEVTGISPRQFHISVRINEAKRLLNTSSLTIGEVANVVGFGDPHYFSRIFSNKAGVSPSDWRLGSD
ncbi:MAG: AraC-like DNA-binding protein [Rhodothermales bacterium]|jgi:AraC-like DNA-binding protein